MMQAGGFQIRNSKSEIFLSQPPVGGAAAAAAAAAAPTISPYQRIAVIQGTWDDVPGIADKIAQYVTLTDEDAELGFTSGGWLIGGAKTSLNVGGETYEFKDLLPIPAMGVPADLTAEIEKKSRVVEFCNGKYAKYGYGHWFKTWSSTSL